MDAKHLEALENQLVQDVADYRRSLLKDEPKICQPELDQKVGAYTASRKAALGLFIRDQT